MFCITSKRPKKHKRFGKMNSLETPLEKPKMNNFIHFMTLREVMTVMRYDYQCLLTQRNYLLVIGLMYHGALEEKENEVEQLWEELSQVSPSPIL
jgi:hypothetical protein